MWIHEAFGAYSESLFLDYHFGKRACSDYVIGTRAKIRNDKPIIGPYNVNTEGSHDMYYKGANMLHTLRQIVDADEKFRQMIRGISKQFYHQTVTSDQIEAYISSTLGMDLKAFFEQYLRDVRVPVFEYLLENDVLKFRWANCVVGFDIPLKIAVNNDTRFVYPTTDWKELKTDAGSKIVTDKDFYVKAKNLGTK
jgi:aminopeptidase N